jgi:hypothetical protein
VHQQRVLFFQIQSKTTLFVLLPPRAISSSYVGVIVVRPHGWHPCLERFKRKLERRARVPDLELLQHARVQDAQPADLNVPLSSARIRSDHRFLSRTHLLVDRWPRTIVDRRGAAREERHV